jgi:hypothetical protein
MDSISKINLDFVSRKLVPLSFLALFALICYMSQREKSVTVDEFNHFPSGIYNLTTLDWRMDRETPPLIKCLPSLTALITKPDMETKTMETHPNPWSFGYDFMFRNFEKYPQIFSYGRYVVILLGCLGGWILYRFGTEIYGYGGGLFALFLYVFNPNIIAHSRLTTIDTGAACTILLSVYCFWKFVRRKDGVHSIIAGIALGMAQLSKFTALLLYPIFIIIFGVLLLRRVLSADHQEKMKNTSMLMKDTGYFFLMLLFSLIVINAGYFFMGSLTPLHEYTFASEPLKTLSSLIWDGLPVPVPYEYLSGFDSQLALSAGENPFYAGYLMGTHSLTGWWYYYIIAFMVKNPVALFIILLIAAYVWVRGRADGPDLETVLCIWVPVVGFFAYFSFLTHIPIGIRFLLPVFPLLFLAAGYILSIPLAKTNIAKVAVLILGTCYLIPTISIFPNYLSYFNLAAGGPEEGHTWLIDSNLDWGQDLPGLKKYMRDKGIKTIKLGYFGRVDPEIYGINYELAGEKPEKGVYAISINYLVGRPYYLLKEHPRKLIYADLNYFWRYRSLKPVDVVGHTILIFKVNDGDV